MATKKRWQKRGAGPKKPAKLFRNLEKDGVTYSFLNQFLQCRESARLSYVEGLIHDGVIDAMDYGSAFHRLLEHQAQGKSCESRYLRPVLEGWLKQEKKFRKLKRADFDQLAFLADIALTVFPYYHHFWKENNGHEFRSDFVCQECPFSIDHTTPYGPIKIRGRFDAVLRVQGSLWLMENKTKAMIDEEGLQASLSQDMQTMLYCHAIHAIYGEQPAGVLYNVIRRPGQRQKKDEPLQVYLDRIAQAIEDDPHHFFVRFAVEFGKHDLPNWVSRTLNPVLQQVQLWWNEIKDNPHDPFANPNRVHHFTNPEGLYTRYGRSEYFELLTRGSMYGLRRRGK